MATATFSADNQGGGDQDWWSSAPLARSSGLDQQSRELAIRTVLGEAANQGAEGMSAVANVIRNRATSGRYGGSDVSNVIAYPHAFEPWGNAAGVRRMYSYAPESEPYQQAASAVDAAFGGQSQDVTGGATHFVNPTVQAQLGRQIPSWAQGKPTAVIGQHHFFAPEGTVNSARADNSASSSNWWESSPLAPSLSERFPSNAEMQPQNANALQAGLERRAQELTQGPATTPTGQMGIDLGNQFSAASQGTSPVISAHQKNLVSNQVYQNDSGELLYRDPATGQLVPTDQSKQVVLRDPADNTLKVYARSENTNEGAAVGVSRTLAPGLAAGAPTARAALPAAKSIQPLASDIFATAKPYYRAFKQEAGQIEIPVETAKDLADRIRGSLDKANLIEELAKPVYAAVGILDKGEPLTVDALQNIKRVVGRSFASPDKNVRDAAAVASREINRIISEVAPEAGQNLRTADQIHSTAMSVQELQRKESVAGLRTGRAGYGGNMVNPMRQLLSPIVQRSIEGRITGFTPNEISAMRDVVEGTPATNTLRLVGQASPAKGVFQTASEIGATVALGPGALAIPALGVASNKLAAILTGRQIQQLKQLVASRSPAYSDAVAAATNKYYRAQMGIINNPTPNTFAAYVSASRALAGGLQRDGIQITSGDLLRRLQSPVQSAAQPNEQEVPGNPRQ